MSICLYTDKKSPEGGHGRAVLLLPGRGLSAGRQGKVGALTAGPF